SAYKLTDNFFQRFVFCRVSTHHSTSHWISGAIHGCCFRIYFTYLWVVYQPQVIIQTPNNDFFSTKLHPGAEFTFQLRKCKIAVGSFHVSANRTVVFNQFFKNVHSFILILFKNEWCIDLVFNASESGTYIYIHVQWGLGLFKSMLIWLQKYNNSCKFN